MKWKFNKDFCEFDRDVFVSLVELFDEMIDDPGEVDFSRYDLSNIEELIEINARLRDYLRNASSVVKVPTLYFDIYVIPWLNHSDDIDLEAHEEALLTDLYLDFIVTNAKWKKTSSS